MKRHPWLLLIFTIVLFHWKLWLTNQYTWLESPDLVSQVLPSYEFSAYEVHHGRSPLWDPYSWGGQPLHAAMQASLAYPPHWLMLAAPLKHNSWLLGLTLNWYYIFIRCLIALGMYALCRDLKRSGWAACLAGLIYSMGGVEVTADWPQMAHAAAWAPIVFLFLLRVLRGEPATRNGIFAGGALGAAWLCGHHAYPTFISLAAAGLWMSWLTSNRTLKNLIPPALSFLTAFLVGAVQLLPAIEFGPLAMRWSGTEAALHWNEKIPYHLFDGLALSPDGMFAFVFPYINQNYTPYFGICAVALALLGAALAWREHAVRILAMLGLGGLAFALSSNTPFHGWLYALVPLVEKTRVPAMATLLTSVAIAALAAYALDEILQRTQSEWNRRFTLGLALFGSAILVFGAILFARRAEVMNGPNTFLLTGLYALMLAAWLAAASQGKLTRNWAAFCPLALVLMELTKGPSSFWRNQQDHSKPSILQPLAEDYKIAEFLKTKSGGWRIETDVPYSFGLWWGIEAIDGLGAAVTSNLFDQDFFSPRFRNFMSVRFRVAEKPANDQQKLVFEGPRNLKVFENPNWMPRAWMVHEAIIEPSAKAMRERLTSDGFNPRDQVLLAKSPTPNGAGPRPAAGLLAGSMPLTQQNCPNTDAVELGRRTPSTVELKVEANCRGMLILNDVYYPGWRATIDGNPQTIQEAYGVVRGVMVEKGPHTVIFEFSPWTTKFGAILSAIGLLTVVATARTKRGT